jgi:hypothetical protein
VIAAVNPGMAVVAAEPSSTIHDSAGAGKVEACRCAGDAARQLGAGDLLRALRGGLRFVVPVADEVLAEQRSRVR